MLPFACQKKKESDSGNRKRSRLFHRKRIRLRLLYPCRTGNFRCNYKSLQHSTRGLLCPCNSICKGKRRNHRRTLYSPDCGNATLPDKISKVLENKERIQWFASKQVNAKDVFFIGRGVDYAICMEGSLKMKEISYIHSEAYAAGELKHGTISLIENNTLVGWCAHPARSLRKNYFQHGRMARAVAHI